MAGKEEESKRGELKKMKIYAYTDVDLEEDHLAEMDGLENPYTALINPEGYTVDLKYEFQSEQGLGTTGADQKFIARKPKEMAFEFLFDNTGIIDGAPKENVAAEVENFRKFLMDYDGNAHQPRFFKFAWGTDLFKGRCASLNIAYKLFNPDGSPIRAICKVTLKEATDEELRVREQNDSSPDLTHYRRIKEGESLPWMCYRIYGDSRYYIEVARVNKLSNFRYLPPGTELFFPPLEKINKST